MRIKGEIVNMKKVIMTGATGMIGVALTKYLIDKDIEVTAICRPNSKKINNLPINKKVRIIECDLENLLELENKLEKDYDAFFNLGWKAPFGENRDNTYLQLENIKYTLDATKLAYSIGCKVFIGAGSQAEYGRVDGYLSDKTTVNPTNGYGIAKYAAGKMSRILAKQLGIKHIWTRILSVYGPGDNDYTMIMSAINKLLNGETPQLTKGEQEWDYLYCDDAARALYLMAINGADGEVYTLGSGNHQPLRRYVENIRDIVNKNIILKFGEKPYAENQVMFLCADINKLTNDTGFRPEVSFDDGIKATIDYIKSK